MIRALMILALAFGLSLPALGQSYNEVPSFIEDVKAGKLPAIAQRLPDAPRTVDFDALGIKPGKSGGEIRILLGKQKDIRMMVVYGYARLVGYDHELNLKPDILKDIEVEEGRIFTLHLRPGHKWSDGHPFTTEDFRYRWEDVINNKKLVRGGVPRILKSGDVPAEFEIIDEHTVRYTFKEPNPNFLPALAGARPFYLYMPAHYMKQFHAKYASEESLKKLAKKYKQKNWPRMHRRLGRQYRPENPDMPTLQPWRNSTRPPSEQFIFKRNPYFHRVDPQGNQLPYIDSIKVGMGSTGLIPTKAGAGETDLQGRYIRFDNYTFLKASTKLHPMNVRLWETAKGSQIALFPNLNAADKVWRDLFRDIRVRRALSVAIDRHEINQAVYYGLARPSSNSVLPTSPLFREEYQKAWTQFDLDLGNKLLDEVGLTERNEEGIRLLPNGEIMQIVVETAGESTEETDVLELVRDNWRKIGVEIFVRPTQRDIFRRRVRSGDVIMGVWSGFDNGIPTAEMSPEELAPTTQEQYQWPLWGQFYETGGNSGEPSDLPEAKKLLSLYEEWLKSTDSTAREVIWHKM
ncbi:MAG: ABC transporter substrate-binding protein, partial [Pseudomonadota bacterium]